MLEDEEAEDEDAAEELELEPGSLLEELLEPLSLLLAANAGAENATSARRAVLDIILTLFSGRSLFRLAN